MDPDVVLSELKTKSDSDLAALLEKRDGASELCKELPRRFSFESMVENTEARRVWELCGLYYLQRNRAFEALALFDGLYDRCLEYQAANGTRVHKGMPLVWMSDCFEVIGCPGLAMRYLMLTLCEDAIETRGSIPADTSGSYFRLVWRRGMGDSEFRRYAREAFQLSSKYVNESLFPEWCLLRLDDLWINSPPALAEHLMYPANRRFIKWLNGRLGDPSGKALEELAAYLISVMPGCRVQRRASAYSTDYDLICSVDGAETDFRSELGRYFVCECKDWERAADFTSMAKFCRVLDSVKARFGVLFSRAGISGAGMSLYAEREQLKMFQDRGVIVVVVDENDLEHVGNGKNFTLLLREKYERVRLDLRARVEGTS